MEDAFPILCEVTEVGSLVFISGPGQPKTVDIEALEKDDILNRVYRIQFPYAPSIDQLGKVVKAIEKSPKISLRFYGNYSEERIDWSLLQEIQSLSVDLWETNELKAIGSLKNLRKLGLTKNVKSKVSLSIIESLPNLEMLFTSLSKDIESISSLSSLKFLSLNEVKTDSLSFLEGLASLNTLWLSHGSINNFSRLGQIKNLQKLWILQVKGFDNKAAELGIGNCKNLCALKVDNCKHLSLLDFLADLDNLQYLSLEGIKFLADYHAIGKSKSLKTITGYDCRPINYSLEGLEELSDISLGDSYPKEEIARFLKVSKAENIWLRGKTYRGKMKNDNPFQLPLK